LSSNKKTILHDFAPALLVLALICAESTSTMSAPNTGGILVRLLRPLFPDYSVDALLELNIFLRKVGHVVGYGLLSASLFRGFLGTLPLLAGHVKRDSAELEAIWQMRCAMYCVLATLIVAMADEIHQRFLRLRTGNAWDVLLDTGAAVAAQLLIFFFLWLRRRNSPVAGVRPESPFELQ
jgi:hypothetical protein